MIARLTVYCLLLLLLAALTACGPAAATVTPLPSPTTTVAVTSLRATATPRPIPPPIEPASKLSRRCDQGQSSTARPLVPGEIAIDFTLKDTKGTAYSLSSLLAEEPIVLIFGSYSSTTFRQQIASDNAMYKNYGARAGFIVIYSKEANPISQKPAELSRDSRGTPITQPATYEQRVAWAARMITETKISMTVLVDEIDNPLWCSYGRMANNAFLIGKDGRIVLRQDWHDAAKLERDLKQYLGIW